MLRQSPTLTTAMVSLLGLIKNNGCQVYTFHKAGSLIERGRSMSVVKLKKISVIVVATVLAVALQFMMQVRPTLAETIIYTYDSNGQLIKADYGNGNTITYTYDEAGNLISLIATGTTQQNTLTVSKSGTGSGTVTSSPAGINCGSDCSESYDQDQGTSVTLTATPATGSTFGGWSGACSGTGACTVTMNAAKSVTATFNLQPAGNTLTVSKTGTGSGTVKSSPTGINCGSDCSEAYNQGTSVTLTATPTTGSTFGGWSGACSGTGACTVTVDGAVTVTAEFALKTPDISVDQTSINFGDIKVGKKSTKTLKITNGGSGDLWITLSGLEGTDFSIQGSSTVTIKSKKSYSLKVLVSPKSAGSKTATLRISSNDPDTPTIDISLKASWTGAIFIDVLSTYWAYDYIIAIYNAGITVGCVQDNPNTPENERRYCPEDSVTRGGIAAFIIRAKYRENFTYTTTPYFSDVPPTHTFFKYVQKLRDDGITVVNGTYGVNELVTRGGIAVFIIRAKYGENFTYTTTPYFTDVPSTHNFFKYVQKLKDDKITTVSGTYGVDQIVTRAGMAASLSRAFLGMQ